MMTKSTKRITRVRPHSLARHTVSLSAPGQNASFELGQHSYRVVLNCRNDDGAAHTIINDVRRDVTTHTPRNSEEVTS